MHSTLRTELRGTAKVFQLLRNRPPQRIIDNPRSFSQQTCLQSEPICPSSSTDANNGCISVTARSLAAAKAAQLGQELEQWINRLSKHGSPLHVWDTISRRDERGQWKLLPQTKSDLDSISRWATADLKRRGQCFGLRIADGRIRALTPQQLRIEQEGGPRNTISGKAVRSAKNTRLKGERDSSVPTEQAHSLKQETSELDQSVNQEQSTGGDGSPKEAGDGSITKFYGSSAARRQRVLRLKEKSTIYFLPSWFREQNVQLWGEGQLDPAMPEQVVPVKDDKTSTSKLALVLPDSTITATQEEILKPSPDVAVTKQDATKDRTHAPGGDNEPTDDDGGVPSGVASTAPRPSPILVPIPDPQGKYSIVEAQLNELMTTARGKLRPSQTGVPSARPSDIKGHLIIHYTVPNGELYLDKLVEDIAKRLQCDLVTLDAQDIAALIVSSDADPLLIDAAKSLSYDIYGELYKEIATEDEQASKHFQDEYEESDDDSNSSMPQGFPFIVGKPITIDLKNLFNPNSSRRSSSLGMPKGLMSELVGRGDPSSSQAHVLGSVVDSVLSSSSEKRQRSPMELTSHEETQADAGKAQDEKTSKRTTIIHIKDLKSVQDTRVGGLFLNRLYEQVEKRRAGGEMIMLVGTECSRQENSVYNNDKIKSIQDESPDHISTTVVVTPAMFDSKAALLSDRNRRFSMINARHLWDTLQSKNLAIGPLKQGFWRTGTIETLHEFDQVTLSKSLWSFSHVQRLAALLASDNFSKSKHPIADATSTLDLSDGTKFSWVNQMWQDMAKTAEKDSTNTVKDRLAKIREKANKHEKRLLGGVVEPKKISTTFQDIHIPPETVDALQTLTTLSLVRPDAFKYGVLSSDRIPGLLLYGPPGTGKTLAAKAVAKESGATMLEVSAADINDMYVGEGEKNVKALFSLAKKLSPCVVFLDEADAMFSARSNQGRRVSHRELLNQFLREWDGMSNDSGSAFIMVATNRPMDLDDAVLRRLPRRLLVDLPTEVDRLEILKIHLRHEHLADDVNLSQIASKTPFYSGSDLKNVAVAAALSAVRQENEEAKNYIGEDQYQYPEKRTLSMKHFDNALEEISASISEDMASLREIKKFDEQYGDRKGRKRKAPRWGFRSANEADKVLDTVKVRS